MRILIVRLRLIGDVVFTTPLVAALRARYPDAHLTYVVEPAAASIVAHNPHLNDVVVAPRRSGVKGLLDDLALGARLRRAAYDIALDLHGGPRASLLTWLSRAPDRIGYDVKGRSWMYTRTVHRPRELRARHSVENQWDLLTPLGFPPPARVANPVEMTADHRVERQVAAILQESGVEPGHTLIVLHVSASSPFRRWPLASFVEAVTALAREADRRIVVTSGPSERMGADHVIEGARARLAETERHRILGWSDFSLPEFRVLLDRAALFIGGDSGLLHIASTSSVPVVAIFGPTTSIRSAPWRAPSIPTELLEVEGLECRPCDQRVCVHGDFRCLTTIGASRVVEASERAMAAGRGARSPRRAAQ